MKKLIYEAIHRRALMFVLFGLLAVIGYYAWTRLAIDAYPDIADVTVQVVRRFLDWRPKRSSNRLAFRSSGR